MAGETTTGVDECPLKRTDADEPVITVPEAALSGRFAWLSTNSLRPGPNLRRNRPRKALAELVESVRVLGILHELIVRPISESDTFELLAGFGRWEAAKECALDTVPCRIVEGKLSPLDIERLQLHENRVRNDLNPMAIGRTLQRAKDERQLTQSELAALFSIPQPRISEYLSLLRLNERDQERLANGDLNYKQACAAAKKRTRRPTRATQLDLTNIAEVDVRSRLPRIKLGEVAHDLAKASLYSDGNSAVIACKDSEELRPRDVVKLLRQALSYWKECAQSASENSGNVAARESLHGQQTG